MSGLLETPSVKPTDSIFHLERVENELKPNEHKIN